MSIENVVTTTDRLFLFADLPDNQADPATKEALRYRSALWRGYQELHQRPLSTNTAVAICRAIKGIDLDIRKTPGTRPTTTVCCSKSPRVMDGNLGCFTCWRP